MPDALLIQKEDHHDLDTITFALFYANMPTKIVMVSRSLIQKASVKLAAIVEGRRCVDMVGEDGAVIELILTHIQDGRCCALTPHPPENHLVAYVTAAFKFELASPFVEHALNANMCLQLSNGDTACDVWWAILPLLFMRHEHFFFLRVVLHVLAMDVPMCAWDTAGLLFHSACAQHTHDFVTVSAYQSVFRSCVDVICRIVAPHMERNRLSSVLMTIMKNSTRKNQYVVMDAFIRSLNIYSTSTQADNSPSINSIIVV